MAHAQRSSSRQVKLRRDPNFVYEEDVLSAICNRDSRGKDHLNLDTDSDSLSTASEVQGKEYSTSVYWSDIDLPLINNPVSSYSQTLHTENLKYLAHLQQVLDSESQTKEEEQQLDFVNTDSRKASSTRCDFLDVEGCFLSASSVVHTNTSEMSSDPETVGNMGEHSKAESDSSKTGLDKTMDALLLAVSKIDKLTDKVCSMESLLKSQGARLDIIEGSIHESDNANDSQTRKKLDAAKVARVEEEKGRQLKFLTDKLTSLGKKDSNSNSNSSDGSSREESESSDDGVNMKSLRQKMSKKKKKRCRRKMEERLKQAGTTFPDDDYETTSTSGN